MRNIGLAATIALSACRYHDLADAPIHGATPEQEALIRGELDAFDAAVGPGRVRIAGVWVDDLKEGRAGQFRRGTRQIRLDPDDGMQRDTVVHELCHALEAAEGLWKGELMEELAEGLFDPDYPYAPTDEVATRSAQARQREAFASFCETGAVAAWAMRRRCPGDPEPLDAIARFYTETVFTAFDDRPLAPGPVVPAPTASLALAWPTEAPDVLALYDGSDTTYADLYTGEPVATPQQLLEGDDTTLPPGLIGLARAGQVAGHAEGPFAAEVAFWLHHLGVSAPRFVAYDGVGWATERDPCDLEGQHVFTADGAVWLQRDDGWQALVD